MVIKMIDWQPVETIPTDGTEILIKTDTGIVSAWFYYNADNGRAEWICYDDMFELDGYDSNITAWAHYD